jgi:hypothetical protein
VGLSYQQRSYDLEDPERRNLSACANPESSDMEVMGVGGTPTVLPPSSYLLSISPVARFLP